MPFAFGDATRTVAAGAGPVRAALVRCLESAGFTVTSSQLTRVEARRGSLWGVAAYVTTPDPRKLPVVAALTLEVGDGTTTVHAAVSDGLASPVARRVNAAYPTLLGEVLDELDGVLAGLDPAAATSFPPAALRSTLPPDPTDDLGEGQPGPAPPVGSAPPGERRDAAASIWFEAPEGVARFTPAEVQAMLAVAVMVAGEPGALPERLTRQLEQVAATVERHLAASGGVAARIPVRSGDRPVVEFCFQQVRLREKLPLRVLHRCRTCTLEKVTNPDFQRLMARNQRLRNVVGLVGATVGRAGISPFVVMGTMFRFASLDPDYVCPRCQGMDAEERIVTFCSGCGRLHKGAVLRTCPCGHDFRKGLTPMTIWGPVPASPPRPSAPPPATAGPPAGPSPGEPPGPVRPAGPPPEPAGAAPARPAGPPPGGGSAQPPGSPPRPPAAPPRPAPAPRAGGAVVCEVCGRPARPGWRLTVAGPDGPTVVTVCATDPACRLPSLTPPERVDVPAP